MSQDTEGGTEQQWQVLQGDCLERMKELPDNSVDAVVSDPPYGLGFMGKEWDHGVPGKEFWAEALRVAKPGAHIVAFGGTRTYHRLACAIEDAGWEIRDCMSWLFGSGFPKSLDVGKAIDKAAGAEREVVGVKAGDPLRFKKFKEQDGNERKTFGNELTAPATDEAKQWQGWGTALKPAWEPIILARKPLVGTVAGNVLAWGTGGVNVDGCRIAASAEDVDRTRGKTNKACTGVAKTADVLNRGLYNSPGTHDISAGRWPANVLLDEDAAAALDAQTGELPSRPAKVIRHGAALGGVVRETAGRTKDTGGASRFFYCAKTSRGEREAGCESMPLVQWSAESGAPFPQPEGLEYRPSRNHHPTVKPISLMRWLVRLVTPPGGLVLDPFNGSGSTGCAAVLEGMRYIGMDLDPEYVAIAQARIAHWASQRQLPAPDQAELDL